MIHVIMYFITKSDGDILRKLSIILCILWMGIIFYNSSRPASVSDKQSYGIVNSIRSGKSVLEGKNNSAKVEPSVLPEGMRNVKIDIIIRKNAHAFEYCMLAVFVSNFLFLYRLKGKNALVYIMFICLLYAVTDEFHQMFVLGRGSLVSDVLIDFMGSLIGLGVFYFAYYKIHTKHTATQQV